MSKKLTLKNSNERRKANKKYQWNLKQFYKSKDDPMIEKDLKIAEDAFSVFSKKFDIQDKGYLISPKELLPVLKSYEKLHESGTPKPAFYFFCLNSLDSSDEYAIAQTSLINGRMAKAMNKVKFFPIALGKLSLANQKKLLADPNLRSFHYFLKCIFREAKYQLSVQEEKILSLKNLPAREMWVSHNDKILDSQVVSWKGENLPVSKALELIAIQRTSAGRKKLADAVYSKLKSVAIFSEGEINAVFTDKKINDELRGFKQPYSGTVMDYQNEAEVIETLRKVVTDNFYIAQKFYKLKAKMMGQKALNYCDRGVSIGVTQTKYSFQDSVKLIKKIFGNIDPKFARIIDNYLANGQIDVYSKKGKTGGAFCSGTYNNPTFILLNHVDSLRSFTTLAHEIGHAFHTELSRSQGPLYCDYSYSLAETASTLFETIAFDAIFEKLSDKEKIIALHDRISESVATVFRQIACFNFELDLHNALRTKGFVGKEEIAEMHNKNMQAYLGSAFKMIPDDGYMFVSWSHIRRFFYVYSYAYGMIVSQAMLRRYKSDRNFWKNIELFLKAGGSNSPENILNKAGIDVRQKGFFQEGIREIEKDIDTLSKLI